MVHLPHYQPPPGTKAAPKAALKAPKGPKAGKAPTKRESKAEAKRKAMDEEATRRTAESKGAWGALVQEQAGASGFDGI